MYHYVLGLDFLTIQIIVERSLLVNMCIENFDLGFEVHLYLDRGVGDHDHTCFNMDGSANDRASSVNTHGGCFILFEHGNCHGQSMRVAPGHGAHNHLGENGFNDKTSSYKIC